jgi:hypothetical protein
MLTGKFASLEEPTEVFEVVTDAVLLADGPKEMDLKGEGFPRT